MYVQGDTRPKLNVYHGYAVVQRYRFCEAKNPFSSDGVLRNISEINEKYDTKVNVHL